MSDNFKGKTYQTKDILDLKEEWKKIALGAITEDTLPAKRAIRYMVAEMSDAIIDPRQDQTPYIQSLVRRGVRYATAHKITRAAFSIAAQKPSPIIAAQKSTRVAAPAPQTAGKESTPKTSPANKHRYKVGDSLRKNQSELFADYEKNDYKRPQGPSNSKGTYFPENDELTKYGRLWTAVGFHMVPEDLPKIIPALRESGLLDVYKIDPALIQELEEEREKMLAAGVDMRLVVPPENLDQVAGSPI